MLLPEPELAHSQRPLANWLDLPPNVRLMLKNRIFKGRCNAYIEKHRQIIQLRSTLPNPMSEFTGERSVVKLLLPSGGCYVLLSADRYFYSSVYIETKKKSWWRRLFGIEQSEYRFFHQSLDGTFYQYPFGAFLAVHAQIKAIIM